MVLLCQDPIGTHRYAIVRRFQSHGEKHLGQVSFSAQETTQILHLQQRTDEEDQHRIDENRLIVRPLRLNLLVKRRVPNDVNQRLDQVVERLFRGDDALHMNGLLVAPPAARA